MQLCTTGQQLQRRGRREKPLCVHYPQERLRRRRFIHGKKGRQILWLRRRTPGTETGPKQCASYGFYIFKFFKWRADGYEYRTGTYGGVLLVDDIFSMPPAGKLKITAKLLTTQHACISTFVLSRCYPHVLSPIYPSHKPQNHNNIEASIILSNRQQVVSSELGKPKKVYLIFSAQDPRRRSSGDRTRHYRNNLIVHRSLSQTLISRSTLSPNP